MRYGQDFGVTSRSQPVLCLWLLGYPEQARRLGADTLADPHTATHPYSHLFVQYSVGTLHCWLRQWEVVQAKARLITDMATEYGLEFYLAAGAILQRWAHAAQLQPEPEHLPRRTIEVPIRRGGQIGLSCGLCVQAHACWRVGYVDEGLAAITEALAHIEATQERWYEAEVWRVRGELTLQQANQKAKIKPSLHLLDGSIR